MEVQNKDQKPKVKSEVSAIRIELGTQKLISSLLAKANRKPYGRKVKASQLILHALSKLDEADIKLLQDQSLSNADRMEMKFREYCRRNSGATRDEFLGQLLGAQRSKSEMENAAIREEKTSA